MHRLFNNPLTDTRIEGSSMRITGAERLFGVLGYLAILFIIPVKVKRDSMFVQFHARQGGVLFITWVVICLLMFIPLLFISNNAVQTALLAVVFVATGLYVLLMLTGIFKVLLGERYRMPVIADIALMLRL